MMVSFLNLALLALIMVVFLAVTSEARTLLDYDSCYNGYNGWRNNGCRGDYWCNNYRWGCDGRYWDGRRWWNNGDRGGFCVGVCFGK
ncbi:hypothetical protein WJX75_001706 [Coccomyxa subellipsoidea]|uniref:Chitin-binding type-1 domain-containing protein n=1 Tax=Coccomyxa subellipsoidea TaxID=248742 RepID=A0ABR2YTD0_9CHLO